MKLSIVTPLKKLVTELEINSVTLPAYKGELTILEKHEPLISTLDTGILSYIESETSKNIKLAVSWGYVEIKNDEISVLAETAETIKDLDFERAKKSLQKSKDIIKTTNDVAVIEKYQSKVRKAETRLKLQ
jgi:F-type H+-transporting ATPase subunit epsilon